MPTTTHITIGDLARRYCVPAWQVRRIVDRLGTDIPRAGLYRLVPLDLLPAIEQRLHKSNGEEGQADAN